MKIRIITPVLANAERWSAALQRADRAFDVKIDMQTLQTLNGLTGEGLPDLVIAEAVSARDLDALEALAGVHPEIDYLLVASELSSEALLRAMRAGVREVLPAPTTSEAMLEAVQRLVRKRLPVLSGAKSAPSHQGEVIGFISCKGGSGATFVAANVAHLLARKGDRRVALIDMNLQFGDAALFVSNERAASNVAEVARNIHRLDAALLQSAMTAASPGLWVLAAPDDPAQAGDVTPEHVQAVLALACTMFDYVVVDVGRTINATTLRTLDACKYIYVVMQLTLPFIRDGRRLREVFRSLDYPSSKLRWIVNRYQKGGDISLDDLKRTLTLDQLITLPNEYEVVASSVNQGIPVERLSPNSPITRALRGVAEAIAPPDPKSRPSGWLSGLLGGGTP
jgi:pilus assembly protein CpaE